MYGWTWCTFKSGKHGWKSYQCFSLSHLQQYSYILKNVSSNRKNDIFKIVYTFPKTLGCFPLLPNLDNSKTFWIYILFYFKKCTCKFCRGVWSLWLPSFLKGASLTPRRMQPWWEAMSWLLRGSWMSSSGPSKCVQPLR